MEGVYNSVAIGLRRDVHRKQSLAGANRGEVLLVKYYLMMMILLDEHQLSKLIYKEHVEQTAATAPLHIKVIMPAPGVPEKTLYHILEQDPNEHFDFIQKESVENALFLPKLASYLSVKALEVICNRVFSKKDVNEEFTKVFYECFFSYFLQRRYTWFSFHLLMKASKAHPVLFKCCMKTVLANTYIKSCVLQDYVERLNKEQCTSILELYQELHFTPEKFSHMLPVTYLLCLNGEMSADVFLLIYSCVQRFSDYCAQNEHYGKLLLLVVESMYARGLRARDVRTLVECHRTTYKSICKSVMKSMRRDIEALQHDVYHEPRVRIPRVSDDGCIQL